MAFDYISHTVDSALLGSPVMSQPVSYSRPAVGGDPGFAAFTLTAIVDSSAKEYTDPNGPFYAGVFVQVASISGGPQKGDLIAINDSVVKAGSYRVQEIFADTRAGSAWLKVRWLGQ